MDSYTNIDLEKLLASAALKDEELAVKLDKVGADKLTFQKIEWTAVPDKASIMEFSQVTGLI